VPLRYLCGGACRAWNRRPSYSQTDLGVPPTDCTALHARARSLLLSALDHLGESDSATTSSRLSRVARQWGDLAFTLMGPWR
jgi:hypothetical protein